jgi:hypothetical protein
MKKGLLIIIAYLWVIMPVFAQDKTLNIYKAGLEIQRFALNNIDSIGFDDTKGLMFIHKKDGTINTIRMAVVDSMDYSSGEYTLPGIETVSAGFDHTLGKAVCLVNITDDGGCEILERGICWSTGQNPTVENTRYASGTNTGKFYTTMTGLNMGSTYYARAYASNCLGTAYGEVVEVKTRMGNVTYTLDVDKTQYPEYYNLLKTALDSACYYYSTYTSFQANIYVYYNAGIPTAQASYHGSIGFGPNTGYMWVGTVMHEMAHYFGSGTTSVWKSLMVGGIWQGSNGQELCQELAGTELKGDNNSNPIHFWPFGINYRSEVSSPTDLINHARIVQAMLVEDCGLPTSW